DHEHDISNAPLATPVYTVSNFNSLLVPEVPCDRAIPPPDIHKIRRQVTQSFSKSPRFSAMNQKYGGVERCDALRSAASRENGGS
ncbi:hypothetical protein, partial [Burkholderia pseudomallei]